MHGHNLVAIYESQAVAERVRERLLADGFVAENIRLEPDSTGREEVHDQPHRHGMFNWLFSENGVPAHDRTVYQNQLGQNRAVVSVYVADEAQRVKASAIMDEYGPIDVDNEIVGETHTETDMGVRPPATEIPRMEATAFQQRPAEEQEQRIPIVKEELGIGKRTAEQRVRVRTYVVETPVERTVMLRDEQVEVERRPVSGNIPGEFPQERTIEMTERHEEAVAERTPARVTEEVVVRKNVSDHQETVHGTERETKVDVERDDQKSKR